MAAIKAGDLAPHSRIYACTKRGHRTAMIHGEKAPLCPECQNPKQEWRQTRHVILLTTKNIKEEFEQKSTLSERISDKITGFCGSMTFVYIHVIWFTSWIWYNLTAKNPFDPYPFGFLVLIVSLEAIILATFILVSQNRENLINSLRAEMDYQVDLKSAKMLAEIRAVVGEMAGSKKVGKTKKKTRKRK